MGAERAGAFLLACEQVLPRRPGPTGPIVCPAGKGTRRSPGIQAGLAQRGRLNSSGGRERALAAQALPGRPQGLRAPPGSHRPGRGQPEPGLPEGRARGHGAGGGAVQGKGASRCVRAFPRGLGEDAGGAGELGSLSGPQLGLWGSESIPAPPARVWGWELKMEPRQGTCARCPSPPCPAVPPLRPRAPGSPRARGARSGGRSGLAAPRCPGRAGRSAARPRRSGCSPLYWEGRR